MSPGAVTPAARLQLSCLQHPSPWLALGASARPRSARGFRARYPRGRQGRRRKQSDARRSAKEVSALLAVRGSTTGVTAPARAATRRRANAQRAVATCGSAAAATCGYLGRSGLVKLIDCSQVLVGEVFACGRKALENRVQQWHHGSGALLNLAYEL
jgi:hypothetical protein